MADDDLIMEVTMHGTPLARAPAGLAAARSSPAVTS